MEIIKSRGKFSYQYRDSETNKLHREDGPAIEYDNGNKRWYMFGKLHREDGPAVIRITKHNRQRVEYWYNGKRLYNINTTWKFRFYIESMERFKLNLI